MSSDEMEKEKQSNADAFIASIKYDTTIKVRDSITSPGMTFDLIIESAPINNETPHIPTHFNGSTINITDYDLMRRIYAHAVALGWYFDLRQADTANPRIEHFRLRNSPKGYV